MPSLLFPLLYFCSIASLNYGNLNPEIVGANLANTNLMILKDAPDRFFWYEDYSCKISAEGDLFDRFHRH